MDAIAMLKQQHREVAALFSQLDKARSAKPRRELFEKIADALAVHAAIEERHFYPCVMERGTEDILRESLAEHLEIKRAIADLLTLDAGDAAFAAKAKILEEDVEDHVAEEEGELFPRVERMFDDVALESIAEAMADTQADLLSEGNPRETIADETDRSAPL
jgi:hemerythrin-like domain-containing protein